MTRFLAAIFRGNRAYLGGNERRTPVAQPMFVRNDTPPLTFGLTQE